MTTADDGRANQADASSTPPSTELVHVPRRSPRRIRTLQPLDQIRGPKFAPDLTPPKLPAQPSEIEFAEKVRTVSLVSATPPPAEHGPDLVLVQQVDGQLRTWLVEAKRSPHTYERERARLGIFAALNAHKAILESRTVDGWKPTVDEFARTWLQIPRPDEDWLEAVSTALLGDWVDLLDEHLLDDAGDLDLKQLKKETTTVHRQLQPLFMRKTRGGRLLSLDHPVTGGGTLTDLLTDRAAPAQSLPPWEPETDHAAAGFARLPRHERDLARIWATAAPASTWTEFADLTGFTDTDADNFRRKLRRLGRQHQQRHADSPTTHNQPANDTTHTRNRLADNQPTTA